MHEIMGYFNLLT